MTDRASEIAYATLLADDPPGWEQVLHEWAARYREEVPGANLLVVDLDSWSYLFHLSAPDPDATIADRVVAAWGKSALAPAQRDRARMRSHPRSVRADDHKGHLIAHASGGGYDINLTKMDSGLNTGRTPEGKKFRAMERHCAQHPGTPYFIRSLYDDDSDRPTAFDVGVRESGGWWIERFANGES